MLKMFKNYNLSNNRDNLEGGWFRGTSAKSPSTTFFKPSLIENEAKIVQKNLVLLK